MQSEQHTATLGYRLGPVIERMPAPADLDRWIAAAALGERTEATSAEYRSAVELREAIYDIGNALLAGRKPSVADVGLVNAAAESRCATQQLDPQTLQIRHVSSASVRAALARVAEDAIALFGGSNRDRLRICKHPQCGALMLKAANGPDRQWCSMATCGNRAKVAAFRKRRSDPA